MSESVAAKLISLRITVLVQLLVTLFFCLLIGLSTQWQWEYILSACAGSLVAMLVFVFGIWRALCRDGGSHKPEQLLLQMYSAEFSKLLLGILLLGLLFKFAKELHAGFIVSGFTLGIISNAVVFGLFGLQHQPQQDKGSNPEAGNSNK